MIIATLCCLLAACGGGGAAETPPDTTAYGVTEVQIDTAPLQTTLSQPAMPAELLDSAAPPSTPASTPDPLTDAPVGEAQAAAVVPAAATDPTAAALASAASAADPAASAAEPDKQIAGQSLLASATTAAAAAGLTLPTTTDIAAQLNANLAMGAQTFSGINCYGRVGTYTKLSDDAIAGSALTTGASLRFGRTTDPLDKTRRAFVFRVGTADTAFNDGRRCEAVAYSGNATGLPTQESFWYAVTLLVAEGVNSQNDSQLLTQWHAQGFNPFMGLYLHNGKLSLTVRYSDTASSASSAVHYNNVWSDKLPLSAKWTTFVFNAKVSPLATHKPFMRVWRDGQLIVDYSGPLGYTTTSLPYAKIGFYSWYDTNPWDTATPVRSVFVRRAGIVKDPKGKFTAAGLRQWVEQR